MKAIKHFFKKYYWRITKGYTCCDFASPNYWIAKKIEPILRDMATTELSSYDPEFNSTEEWQKVILKMADGFKATLLLDESFSVKETKKLHKQQEEGLKMFAKYFSSLWI